MSRQVSIVALVLLAVLGSLALAAAAERKEAGGKAKSPPAAAEPTTAPPKQITNSIGMKLTLVPSGVFMMGSGESAEETEHFFNKNYRTQWVPPASYEEEHPQHRVHITKAFYLGTYHVTRGQFRQFVKNSGYKTDAETGDDPGAVAWDLRIRRSSSTRIILGGMRVSNRPTNTPQFA